MPKSQQLAILLVGFSLNCLVAAQLAAQGKVDFAKVRPLLEKVVASHSKYEQGDLISQRGAQKSLQVLEKLEFDVSGAKELVDRCLPAGDFLLKMYGSRQGTEFLRNVARTRGGYEKLDKLRQINGGERLVKDLSTQRGGHELINYMANSRGGRNLGTQLSRGPGHVNVNGKTNRLYTSDSFLEALQSAL